MAGSRHPGLPFVPAPGAAESLGSWLLRVAEFYGLLVPTFLARISAWQDSSVRVPAWFMLQPESLRVEQVASALHITPSALDAMAPVKPRPRQPAEFGFCGQCLEEAVSGGQPFGWHRRWTHPLATVCEVHRTWLIPIAEKALRRVRRASDLETLAQGRLPHCHNEPDARIAPVDDAAWLQQLCLRQRDVAVPWGFASPIELCQVINGLTRELHLPGEVRQEFFEMPTSRSHWQLTKYTVQDGPIAAATYLLPTTLRARQWIMGVVGHVLRRSASKRRMPARWPTNVVNSLARAAFEPWPVGALAWISPEAMDASLRLSAEGGQRQRRQARLEPVGYQARLFK